MKKFTVYLLIATMALFSFTGCGSTKKAQEEADQIIADANKEAETIISDAKEEAEDIVKSAKKEAEEILASAEKEDDFTMSDLNEMVKDYANILESYSDIASETNEMMDKISENQ